MFIVKKSFTVLLEEFARKDIEIWKQISPIFGLLSAKAEFCMENFFPIMNLIHGVEMKQRSNEGVECYTISEEGDHIIWRGYESDVILRQEEKPATDFDRPWEVTFVRDNPSKTIVPLIFFYIDDVKFNVSKIYLEMAKF